MFRISPMHLDECAVCTRNHLHDFEAARNGVKKRTKMDIFYNTNFTLLHNAAEEGDVSLLSDYLKHSILDINAETSDGDTAMLLAAKNWHERAVQLLIEYGADINCTDSDKWTILHYACLRGWIEIVQFFAEHKDFNINAKTCQGQTALMIAVEEGNEDVAEVLLKSGADVTCCDKNEWNLLHYASHFALYDVVHFILEKKLCPVNSRTSSRDTPLLLAADSKDGKIAELLEKFKDDINCCCNENYNLVPYATENHWAIVNLKNFDLNVRTSEGHTALYLACAVLHLSEFHRKQTCFEIIGHQDLKQHILKDKELCTQIVMNNFNHVHLPALYQTPLVSHLPPNIKGFQIDSNKGVAGDIKSCVDSEIKTKEFCNVMEIRPMVLQMMCVQSLIGYYSTLKQSVPFCSNNSLVKKSSLTSNSRDLNYMA
ncbi:hypothetical protein JTE90_015273 [Oedothorax gibbosus]|uniref:Alpha-latrotoxin n=1 Tax=Oedothorax gibbosus TaxID=931172 RepID=A0AAV6UD04_9ARAC|nr:hypothetical protein JTE90_015273 [Oedothorax gibbosus]